MNRIRLSDYVKEHGQAKTAEALDLTQGALSKALRAGRDIYIVTCSDGSVAAEEVKAFPSQYRREVFAQCS
ncbi:MAG TPA: hypothetical protein GX005_09810 [Bacteroidales bacterium]|nr:hypothetical protein [Bacteroidales bacterium]